MEIALTDGSLLLIDGEGQSMWSHGIPKELHITEGRINLTFRNML